MMPTNRPLAIALTAAISLPTFAATAQAHPMGNFSINHYAHIAVGGDRIDLRYIIDMAEIPTFQVIEENRIVPKPSNPTVGVYLKQQARTLAQGLSLTLNDRPVALKLVSDA